MKIYCTCRVIPIVVLLSLLLAFFCVGAVASTNNSLLLKASTEEQRYQFLNFIGASGCGDPVDVRELMIPTNFGDVYENYACMQNASGFDLYAYRGRTVQQFTYAFREKYLIHLLVADGKIIAGDICDPALGGQMLPLGKESVYAFDTP